MQERSADRFLRDRIATTNVNHKESLRPIPDCPHAKVSEFRLKSNRLSEVDV